MRKELFVVGLVLVSVFFISLAIAEGNESNSTGDNSSNNETNMTNVTVCFDSDGGKDYEEKGKVWAGTGCVEGNCTNITFEEVFDSCVDNKTLTEGYCLEGVPSFKNFTCSGTCETGKCIPLNTTITCDEDSDCPNEKECEDNICVLDDEDDDDNETDDDDEVKVCCRVTEIRKGQEETRYGWKEESQCVSENETDDNESTTRMVVNNSFCAQSGEKQRIKFEDRTGQQCLDGCVCMGVVMRCELEGGRIMTIYARSGNIIIQVKETNMTTNVTLYKDENGTLYGVFRGTEKKIRIMPDEVREKIKERIKAKQEQGEIELDENGNYKVKVMKKARLIWVIPVDESVDTEINSETGVFVKLDGRWWGWMANDVDEE
jgi:hypothetical protein